MIAIQADVMASAINAIKAVIALFLDISKECVVILEGVGMTSRELKHISSSLILQHLATVLMKQDLKLILRGEILCLCVLFWCRNRLHFPVLERVTMSSFGRGRAILIQNWDP